MTLEKRINEWLKDTSKPLDISRLRLKEWPELLKGKEHLIVRLYCILNQLKSLPDLPNLIELYCDHNQITSLLNFPNLTELYCTYNKLQSLPDLPNLIYLECGHNQLESLPNFPNLTSLNCSDNQLKYLPNFPKLIELQCGSNQLESLSNYPNLVELYCKDNQLKSLPNFPNLTWLKCDNNQLFSDYLSDWWKVWYVQNLRQLELRKRGLSKVLKIMRLRLYLPRLTNLHEDMMYSPHHPGKFYKLLRLGDWSSENSKLNRK